MMKKQKGIHVAVYVSKFKDSYDLLKKAQLIWTNPKFARLDTCDTWKDAKAGRLVDDVPVVLHLQSTNSWNILLNNGFKSVCGS